MITVISSTLGFVCLLIAFLIWWRVPDFRFAPIIQIGLLITAAVGISGWIGGWVDDAIMWIGARLGDLFGSAFGGGIQWALALVCAFVVVFDLIRIAKDKSKQLSDAGGVTGLCAFLLPFTASALPGGVGTAVESGVGFVASGVGTAVAAAFGMR